MGGMMNEVPLILYSTVGCHLCEEAEALLRAQQALSEDLCWEVVDIANDDILFDRYGWLIPVLHKVERGAADVGTEGKELRWPFNAQTLRAFLVTSGP
ncbi:MAG: hypothetical protein ACI8RN_003095 [Glaciecola sp.]|jgi:hypothetical protein